MNENLPTNEEKGRSPFRLGWQYTEGREKREHPTGITRQRLKRHPELRDPQAENREMLARLGIQNPVMAMRHGFADSLLQEYMSKQE